MTIFAYTLKVVYGKESSERTIKIEREQATDMITAINQVLIRYAGLRPRVIEAKEGW